MRIIVVVPPQAPSAQGYFRSWTINRVSLLSKLINNAKNFWNFVRTVGEETAVFVELISPSCESLPSKREFIKSLEQQNISLSAHHKLYSGA